MKAEEEEEEFEGEINCAVHFGHCHVEMRISGWEGENTLAPNTFYRRVRIPSIVEKGWRKKKKKKKEKL